jgi:4a-hydroxytetrahydrobiopterin dehydratase
MDQKGAMSMSHDLLDDGAIAAGLARLHDGWSGDRTALKRSIEFADFLTAVDFVSRLAPFVDELDHHPDLRLSWRWVEIEVSTHSAGGVTDLDLRLAGIVDEVAAALPLA